MATTQELIDKGKTYVLQENPEWLRRTPSQRAYYTGKRPSYKIADAKFFTFDQAKGAKKFAKTGHLYNVVRVPTKVLFVMLLSGE